MRICVLLDRVREKYGCWMRETRVLALIIDSQIKMYETALQGEKDSKLTSHFVDS